MKVHKNIDGTVRVTIKQGYYSETLKFNSIEEFNIWNRIRGMEVYLCSSKWIIKPLAYLTLLLSLPLLVAGIPLIILPMAMIFVDKLLTRRYKEFINKHTIKEEK